MAPKRVQKGNNAHTKKFTCREEPGLPCYGAEYAVERHRVHLERIHNYGVTEVGGEEPFVTVRAHLSPMTPPRWTPCLVVKDGKAFLLKAKTLWHGIVIWMVALMSEAEASNYRLAIEPQTRGVIGVAPRRLRIHSIQTWLQTTAANFFYFPTGETSPDKIKADEAPIEKEIDGKAYWTFKCWIDKGPIPENPVERLGLEVNIEKHSIPPPETPSRGISTFEIEEAGPVVDFDALVEAQSSRRVPNRVYFDGNARCKETCILIFVIIVLLILYLYKASETKYRKEHQGNSTSMKNSTGFAG